MENKRKKYREDNKEKIKQYRKEYYLKNKINELEYQKNLPKIPLTDEEKERNRLYSIEYRKNNVNKVSESRQNGKIKIQNT